MTKYKLAQLLAEADGRGKDPRSFTTKVGKVIADPRKRVFENVEQIVNLLDGEIIIRWTDVREQVVSGSND